MVASPGLTLARNFGDSTFEIEPPADVALLSRSFDSIVFAVRDKDRHPSDIAKVDDSIFLLPSCTDCVDSIQGSRFDNALSTFTVGIDDCLWLTEQLCGAE
jgi:hypothetical protein